MSAKNALNPDTPYPVEVKTPTAVDAKTIPAPKPGFLKDVGVDNLVMVRAPKEPGQVVHTPVTLDDEFCDESLNRTAKTLGTSVDTSLQLHAKDVGNILNMLSDGLSHQANEVAYKINHVVNEVNCALEEITGKNIGQNDQLVNAINEITHQMMGNIKALKEGIENSQSKLAALSQYYATDEELADQIKSVTEKINEISQVNSQAILDTVNKLVTEVNAITRIFDKVITVNGSDGHYLFKCEVEGAGAFNTKEKYHVVLEVIDNPNVRATLHHQTQESFLIKLLSDGVHFVPQPHNAATVPVKVRVRMTFEDRTPLTPINPEPKQ